MLLLFVICNDRGGINWRNKNLDTKCKYYLTINLDAAAICNLQLRGGINWWIKDLDTRCKYYLTINLEIGHHQ
jgi:hypothetical protein